MGPQSSLPELESTKTKADTSPDPVQSNATRGYSALGMIRARLSSLFSWPRIGSAVLDRAPREQSEEGESADLGAFANAADFNPLPPDPDIEGVSSDEIFAEIGRELRARREMLSLTYEEIERHTRIRVGFLKALDEGALDSLPSPVQTRGILANYAAFIDLDVEAVLLRFADGIQARHREQRPHWPPRTRSPMTVHSKLPPLRSFIASDLLFGGGAAIVLILFALWGINRVMAVRAAGQGQPMAPSISDVLAAAPLPTVPSEVTLIPAQDTVEAPTLEATAEEPAAPVDPSITVDLRLRATERTYLRVLVDDRPAFEGRAEPGKEYYYQAVRQIELLVGNAAGIRVTHNGQDLGILGRYGEVVDQVYTARGVLTPTPTVPPTFTPSLTPTPTPRATPTLATYTPTVQAEE